MMCERICNISYIMRLYYTLYIGDMCNTLHIFFEAKISSIKVKV